MTDLLQVNCGLISPCEYRVSRVPTFLPAAEDGAVFPRQQATVFPGERTDFPVLFLPSYIFSPGLLVTVSRVLSSPYSHSRGSGFLPITPAPSGVFSPESLSPFISGSPPCLACLALQLWMFIPYQTGLSSFSPPQSRAYQPAPACEHIHCNLPDLYPASAPDGRRGGGEPW